MINITSIRWRAIIGSSIIVTSFVISSISGVLINSSTASAYTYTDSSITSKADCEAAGGTWETQTSPLVSYCNISSSPDQDAKVLLSAGWLSDCVGQAVSNSHWAFSPGDIADYNLSLHWSNNKIIGYVIAPDNGQMDCDNANNVQAQLNNLKYTNLLDFLVDAGCKKISDTTAYNGSYSCNNLKEKDIFNKIIAKHQYGTTAVSLTEADRYYIALQTFMIGCKATPMTNPNAADIAAATDPSSKIFNVTEVDSSGIKTEAIYKSGYDPSWGVRTKDAGISTIPESVGWTSNGQFTCQSLANMTTKYASGYASWAKANPQQSIQVPNTANKNTPQQTCGSAVTGLGWILCPIITGMSSLNDTVWNVVGSLLNVNPIQQTDPVTNKDSSIYQAWGSIRSIANVLFVIFFLFIIFSQLTGFGIDNYGIKKLLPRLIICAILVNVSFIVVQVSVDVFNIVGKSLYDLIIGMSPTVSPRAATWTNLISITTGATGLGIAGVALAGGVGTAFWMILPMILMALLGLLTAILTLIFRQAVIPVLAILAPLAFVAYMLPNTQSWFKKWRDMLLTMLMMYPMAALVFGGAQFAAYSIIGTGNPPNGWNLLIGLIMLALPLFSLPFIARQGGPMLSKVGGAMNKLADKARSPLSSWGKGHEDLARANYQNDTRPQARTAFGRLARNMAPRNINRGMATRRTDSENKTNAAKEEFKSQGINNEVRGAFGRPIDVRTAAKRLEVAKQHSGIDQKEIQEELLRENPANPLLHGGIGLNDRKFKSDQKYSQAESLNTARIANEQGFNAIRAVTEQNKTDADTATKGAEGRVEQDAGTLLVRASNKNATEKLENTKGEVEQVIQEASAGVSVADEAITSVGRASDIDATTSRQLQDNKLHKQVVGSATAAATQKQTENITEALLEPDPLTGEISHAAVLAGGMGGEAATARAQAGATSAQATFRKANVDAAGTLFSAQRYSGGLGGKEPRDLDPITGQRTQGQLLQAAQGHLANGANATSEQQEAAMQALIQMGDYDTMEYLTNYVASPSVAGTDNGVVLQQALAKMFISSSKKPKFVSGGTIGQLSTGTLANPTGATNVTDSLILKTATAEKFAPKDFIAIDKDEISRMATVIAANPGALSTDQRSRLLSAAMEARTNPDITPDVAAEKIDPLDALIAAL